tara:strand:+ start:23626 stop:24390 length:765 start_codon:yes stop_codon:yes gene_type:complete
MLIINYEDEEKEDNTLSFHNKDEFEFFLFKNQHYFPKIFKCYNYSINEMLNFLSTGFLIFILAKHPHIIQEHHNYNTDSFFKNNIFQNIVKMTSTFEKHDTLFSQSVMINFSTLEDYLKYRLLNGYFISINYYEDFNKGSLFEFCIETKSIQILEYLLKNKLLLKEQIKRLLSLGFFNDMDSLFYILENYTSNDFLEFYFNNFEVPIKIQEYLTTFYSEKRMSKLYSYANERKERRLKLENENIKPIEYKRVNF